MRLEGLWPYPATAALVLLGVALRYALEPLAGDFYNYTVFYAVVPLVAWHFGLRAGLLAVVLSAVLAHFLLVEPHWRFSIDPRSILGLALFLVIGTGLVFLGSGIRQSRKELNAKAEELKREISERVAAEANVARLNAQLSERVDELQAVINASPIAIGVATDREAEHTWGNEALSTMLGVPPGTNISKSSREATRLPYKILRNNGEIEVADLPMQYSARHGVSVHNAEMDIVRADGRRLTVLGNAAPLHDAAGGLRGAVGLFMDITDRRVAEREREEASRRKDEFLATLAHELRNPLAPLRNAASIIRYAGRGDEKLQRASDVIERQVVHMTRLVDDLLDVARVTHGLITLQQEPVDLRSLVWQAVELARPLVDGRKQKLHVELPMHALPLYVDRVRIIQAITNVLTNAAKYTPEGGSILVSAVKEPTTVRLRIRDSGIGISPDLLPKVFDVFVQGDRSLARTEGGLGIGLTLVKRIVELHHGRIEAASAGADQGAEFSITLPLAEQPPIVKSPQALPRERNRQRVLVVDDNADVADTLTVLLGMIGHDARTAYTAEEALSLAPNFKPTLAFFDIGLPGMDGYELARRFRADPQLKSVHLVALTGYGREADRARSVEAGFELHLTKPFDPDRLEKLVQEITSNHNEGSRPSKRKGNASETLVQKN